MEITTLIRANVDRVVAAALTLAGAIFVVIGWIGVSGTGLAAQQIPYLISGGLGGITLVAIGCTVWVSADLHDEWRRLDALDERLADLAPVSEHGGDHATVGSQPDAEKPRPATRRPRRTARTEVPS